MNQPDHVRRFHRKRGARLRLFVDHGPLALLFLSNRVLNPALILIEVPLNAYVLWVNREAVPRVWRRTFPIVVGLLPGVLVGTQLVSNVSPDWLKLYTFAALLPLILVQAAGFAGRFGPKSRWASPSVRGWRALFGDDDLRSALAIALNNQGLAKKDFRAALGVIRLAESSLTLLSYLYWGLLLTARASPSSPGLCRASSSECRSGRGSSSACAPRPSAESA
jgi:uncharacterized membrane protein YfcA